MGTKPLHCRLSRSTKFTNLFENKNEEPYEIINQFALRFRYRHQRRFGIPEHDVGARGDSRNAKTAGSKIGCARKSQYCAPICPYCFPICFEGRGTGQRGGDLTVHIWKANRK